ncbi:type II toxin-antitoxin system RelE/ParE family toxin [Komagataeibacter melaceti]|uniref:hypothetical protein n=1 Tax=Komagataeibacter melaceti TaxID=2766577 RepID=UPI001F4E0916|nr:hypothetical protein [Komagataeibacter melaceti]
MSADERTTAFKRDFKRVAKGPHRAALDTDLRRIIELLVADAPLETPVPLARWIVRVVQFISGRKSGADMARLYGVSQSTVSHIVAAHA